MSDNDDNLINLGLDLFSDPNVISILYSVVYSVKCELNKTYLFTLHRIDRSRAKIYAYEASHVRKHHFGTLGRKAKSLQENENVWLIIENDLLT